MKWALVALFDLDTSRPPGPTNFRSFLCRPHTNVRVQFTLIVGQSSWLCRQGPSGAVRRHLPFRYCAADPAASFPGAVTAVVERVRWRRRHELDVVGACCRQ